MVRVDMEFEVGEIDRLKRAIVRNEMKICQQIADLAASNASSLRYNEGRTPNVDYHANVEVVGETVFAELEAEPLSPGADINLRIALKGRKAYWIRPKPPGRLARSGSGRTGMLLWPAGEKGDPIDRATPAVFKKALPPVLGGNFIHAALKNAIQQVRRRYGG